MKNVQMQGPGGRTTHGASRSAGKARDVLVAAADVTAMALSIVVVTVACWGPSASSAEGLCDVSSLVEGSIAEPPPPHAESRHELAYYGPCWTTNFSQPPPVPRPPSREYRWIGQWGAHVVLEDVKDGHQELCKVGEAPTDGPTVVQVTKLGAVVERATPEGARERILLHRGPGGAPEGVQGQKRAR